MRLVRRKKACFSDKLIGETGFFEVTGYLERLNRFDCAKDFFWGDRWID